MAGLTLSMLTQRVLTSAFDDFSTKLPGLVGLYVCTVDGHPVIHYKNSEHDASRISAISGSLLSLSETLIQELAYSDCQHVTILTPNGPVVLLRVPDVKRLLVMCVAADQKTPLGSILSLAKDLSQDVANAVDENT